MEKVIVITGDIKINYPIREDENKNIYI